MRKTVLLAGMLAMLGALTSCLRGDDLDMLRHPIHVSGTMDPRFGIPVGYGEMNVNDLLSQFSSNHSSLIDMTTPVLTLVYDTSVSDTIKAFGGATPPPPTPPIPPIGKRLAVKDVDTTVWWQTDTVVSDTIEIDFFRDAEALDHISMDSVLMDLTVGAHAQCAEVVRPHISASFDGLQVTYQDHAGATKTLEGLSVDPVYISDISQGFTETFEKINVAPMMSDRPQKIIATYHFHFNVKKSLIADDLSHMNISAIMATYDTLGMTELIYSASMHVNMPLKMNVSALGYDFNVDLKDGMASVNLDSMLHSINEGINLVMDSTLFRLVLDNGIPLQLKLTAEMLDADSVPLFTMFANEIITMAQVDGTGMSVISEQTELARYLTRNELDMMKQARSMNVKITLDSNSKHVVVRTDDFLKIKAYLQIHPQVNIDIHM